MPGICANVLRFFPKILSRIQSINVKCTSYLKDFHSVTNSSYHNLSLPLSLYGFQCTHPGGECHRFQSLESTPAGEDTPPPPSPAASRMLGGRPSEPEAEVGRKCQQHTHSCSACRWHGLHTTDGGQEPQVEYTHVKPIPLLHRCLPHGTDWEGVQFTVFQTTCPG